MSASSEADGMGILEKPRPDRPPAYGGLARVGKPFMGLPARGGHRAFPLPFPNVHNCHTSLFPALRLESFPPGPIKQPKITGSL